jgi:osmotically-inducible protein OsmY
VARAVTGERPDVGSNQRWTGHTFTPCGPIDRPASRAAAAAEQAVRGLIGLRHVRNEIEVTFDVGPADAKQVVKEALERNALIPDGSDVAVDASGSTVILRGQVRTKAERDAVVGAAWMAHGLSLAG